MGNGVTDSKHPPIPSKEGHVYILNTHLISAKSEGASSLGARRCCRVGRDLPSPADNGGDPVHSGGLSFRNWSPSFWNTWNNCDGIRGPQKLRESCGFPPMIWGTFSSSDHDNGNSHLRRHLSTCWTEHQSTNRQGICLPGWEMGFSFLKPPLIHLHHLKEVDGVPF